MAAKTKDELKGIGILKADIRSEIASLIMSVQENFICLTGGRSIGKTYTVQMGVIDYCYQNDMEFILVVETRDAKDSGALRQWVEKVTDEQFKDYEFKFTSEHMYMKNAHKDEDWKRIGVCIPLTKAIAYKRNTYPHCRFIIMDEAILADGQYMDAYMDWFLTIYQTADKERNVIKAILIGNTMQKINPIYEFFDISVSDLKKVGLVKRGVNKYFWYIPTPPDLEKSDDNIFRKMIAGTKYGDMANGKFNTEYGYLIQSPKEGTQVYQNYGMWLGDRTCVQILECDDGFFYAESVPEEHMLEYCNPIFTTTYKKATSEYPLIPQWFIDNIKRTLSTGLFKFIDEEALLVISSKFKAVLHINIQV